MPEPGQYDAHLKPFGSDVKSFTMGSKYKWKPDENPPIGGYDVEGAFKSLNKSKSAIIRKEVSPYRRPKDGSPDPGAYDGHLTKFGSNTKSFTIGLKMPESHNNNPGVGYYNPDKAESVTKSRVRYAHIKEPSLKFPKR